MQALVCLGTSHEGSGALFRSQASPVQIRRAIASLACQLQRKFRQSLHTDLSSTRRDRSIDRAGIICCKRTHVMIMIMTRLKGSSCVSAYS